MRTYVAVLFAVACLGLSACGSDSASHDVVPSTVPALTPPPGAEALAQTSTGASGTSHRHHLHRPDRHDVHRSDPDPGPGVGGRDDHPGPAPGSPPRAARAGRAPGTTGGTQSGGTSSGGTGRAAATVAPAACRRASSASSARTTRAPVSGPRRGARRLRGPAPRPPRRRPGPDRAVPRLAGRRARRPGSTSPRR